MLVNAARPDADKLTLVESEPVPVNGTVVMPAPVVAAVICPVDPNPTAAEVDGAPVADREPPPDKPTGVVTAIDVVHVNPPALEKATDDDVDELPVVVSEPDPVMFTDAEPPVTAGLNAVCCCS